jgi:CheY-like chemotaxis protein
LSSGVFHHGFSLDKLEVNDGKKQNITPYYNLMHSLDETPKTIMIVEDDISIREVLQESLESEGFLTVQAENGKEGLDKLASIPKPSVILLDMMMPVMDGRKFLDIVKQDPNLKTIPIIVVSANASPVQANGAHAFIPKPIDFDYLMLTIRRLQASVV